MKIYEGARDNMDGPGSTVETFTVFDGLYLPVAPVRAQMTGLSVTRSPSLMGPRPSRGLRSPRTTSTRSKTALSGTPTSGTSWLR